MKTAEVAARLDSFFRVASYPAEDFAEIEGFCREAGVPLEQYATAEFMRRHNGLMLRNNDEVERVFTLVFPSDDVLTKVARRAGGRAALIFTHHPMDFETSGRGLLPVGEAQLQRLREARISLYSAHAPLDCHEAVSTSRALARAVGVPADRLFAGYHGGHAGVIGEIQPTPLDEFVERVRDGCGVERVDVKRHETSVARVAVVAGGAGFPEMLQEAIDAGCDTYLTGDFRVRHGGAWAEKNRPRWDAFIESAPLNLIGGSHFATEGLVLRHDMIEMFAEIGLEAEFVEQEDAWR